MQEKEVDLFLKDLTFESSFSILDEAKNKNEIEAVAKKARIVWPSPDLAIFKCVYAFTDRQNKNGCTLPKEEVEKSLPTLIGKSIDLDHFRKSVVGTWVDAKLDGNKIIAYGSIFKSSFKEDYDVIKELFDNGNLAVSFESWGTRVYKASGGYDLIDPIFAGGALLLKEKPAFAGAGVLELAKNRILEFAKVMTAPETFLHIKEEKKMDKNELENSGYTIWDANSLLSALSDVTCPCCEEAGRMRPTMVDYKNNKTKTECMSCSAEAMVDLTPQATMTKKGRKVMKMASLEATGQIDDPVTFVDNFDSTETSLIRLEMMLEQSLYKPLDLSIESRTELNDEEFAIVANAGTTNKKIRLFPIHDSAHIEDASLKLDQAHVKDFMSKLGINQDNVTRKISRRRINIAMKTLLEKYKKGTVQEVIQEVAKVSIGRELSKEELEKAQLAITSLQTLKKSTANADAANHPLQDLNKVTPANDIHAHKSAAPSNDTSIQTASVTEDQLKEIITTITKKPDQASDELALLKASLADLTAKLESATAELKGFKDAQTAAEKASRDAKIKSRKDELGDFAKAMSDEDVLDETKYEMAKLKKENAELKAGATKTTPAITTASTTTTPDLSIGSEKKPEVAKTKKSVDDIFFSLIDKDAPVEKK